MAHPRTTPKAAPNPGAAKGPVNISGFADPKLPPCPNCTVGVVYVVAWDPDAIHEKGQPIYHPAKISGGSVVTGCFNCGHRESHAMNPQDAPVDPRPGA